MFKRSLWTFSVIALVMLGASAQASTSPRSAGREDSNAYGLRRLVSDQAGEAAALDPNLVNAWGLVAGPSTPWWWPTTGPTSRRSTTVTAT